MQTMRHLLTSIRRWIIELNLFKTDSSDLNVILKQRKTTRLYLILLIPLISVMTFYYSLAPGTTIINIDSPTYADYVQFKDQRSFVCPCSTIAVKYEKFVQLEPTYHKICRSIFVSDQWIYHLHNLYLNKWTDVILSDIYRIAVFQFRTLDSLCRLAQETIAQNIQSFYQTDLIQQTVISEDILQPQIDSLFISFTETTCKTFLLKLRFMQEMTAQSLLFTGASVTSVQPTYLRLLNINGAGSPHYGIQYFFLDGSHCTCSSSTATTCMGLASFNNTVVTGFYTGCYMLSALLRSTLEAFHNQTFIDQLTETSALYEKLNTSTLNQSIETLLSQMFVTNWSQSSSFQHYFNACAPDSCQYTLTDHNDISDTIIYLISLTSGLSSILSTLAPLLITIIWPFIHKLASRQRQTTVTVLGTRENVMQILKQKLVTLNLFKNMSTSEGPDFALRLQRYVTRVYTINFIFMMIILIFFTSLRSPMVTIRILSPSLDTFKQISEEYSSTLECPCSQTAIKYQELIFYMEPKYHEVCSSDLVSFNWIQVRFIQNSDTLLWTHDVRHQFHFHFQLLSTLCKIAQAMINDSIQSFYQNELISPQVLTQKMFEDRIKMILDGFENEIPQSFLQVLEIIITNLEINQFITPVNAEFRSRLGPIAITQAVLVYSSFHSFIIPKCQIVSNNTDLCLCFPLSYYLCYIPTVIPEESSLTLIPGMFQTWFPLQALLGSTLECFYNQTCFSQIIGLINTTTSSTNFTLLQAQSSIPIAERAYESIESIVRRLFVDFWTNRTSYESYFVQCRPSLCQYNYRSRWSPIYVITTMLGLIGGVNIVLRFLSPLLVTQIFKIWKWRHHKISENSIQSMTHINLRRRTSLWERFIKTTAHHLLKLNLFSNKYSSQDVRLIQRGRQITRIYLILLLASLFIVIFNASIKQETMVEIVTTPSLTKYDHLYSRYASTIRCPCSQTIIKYDQFISRIEPEYHEVCSSIFVSAAWAESLYDSDDKTRFMDFTDFRVYIRLQFQTLSKLCTFSQKMMNVSITKFLQKDFITSTLLSRTEFSIQIHSIVEQFKRTTIHEFLQTMKQMQLINHGNQLATVLSTNWKFFSKLATTDQERTQYKIYPVFAQEQTYGDEHCSCALKTHCSQQLDFPFRASNQSWRQVLPGFLSGCYILDAFLESSFTCLYNQTCLELMRAAIYYRKPIPIKVLNKSSRWTPNTIVQAIFDQLFITHWYEEISYEFYYHSCSPVSCHYSYVMQYNPAYVFAAAIAIFGGFTKGLRFLLRLCSIIIFGLIDRRKARLEVVPSRQIPATQVPSESILIETISSRADQENMTHVEIGNKEKVTLACLIVLGLSCIIVTPLTWLAARNQQSPSINLSSITLFELNLTNTNAVSTVTTTTTSSFIDHCNNTLEYHFEGYRTGLGPVAIVTGDFNRDAVLDVIVTNSGDDTLSILLGNGDGTFQHQQRYQLANGSRPWGITAADFNRDGLLDLVVTLAETREIVLIFGIADPNLFDPLPIVNNFYRKESIPGEIQAGDMNGDGFADIAVCIQPNEISSGFSIYFYRNESRGFQEIAFGFDYLVKDFISVAIGDLDGDGNVNELAGVTQDGNVLTIRAINFNDINDFSETQVSMYAYPSLLIMGHFNWDIAMDLALISSSSDTIQILLAYEGHTFIQHMYLTDTYPTSIARIHFNNDRIDDLVVLHCNRLITVFVGTDIGLFHQVFSTSSPPFPTSSSEECARSVVVNDFNNDGKDDIIYIDAAMERVQVLIGTVHCHLNSP